MLMVPDMETRSIGSTLRSGTNQFKQSDLKVPVSGRSDFVWQKQ